MPVNLPEEDIGLSFSPEVKNVIALTMSFTKAVNEGVDAGENLVVSPYNAMACLAMAALASAGETRAEFAKMLFNVDADALEAEVDKYQALNTEILESNKDQVTLSTANGLWSNNLVADLDEDFADKLKESMGAEISGEDFSDPAVVEKINEWADRNTNGLIKEILDSLDASSAAVLASSLYFKGDWTNQFDKELTEDKLFKQDGGLNYDTPTMHHDIEEGMVSYLEDEGYEAAAMTFGKEDWEENLRPTMRLVLVRPKDDSVTARDWLVGQDADKVPVWMEPMAFDSAIEGVLEMPKMDMEESYDLNGALQDMGIQKAFGGAADFSPMTGGENNFYVGRVKQDVVFKADEEGAEAAAITSMILECASLPMPATQIDFKLDRSFVLMLQDVKTGAPLFIGAVNKPNEDMTPKPVICPRPM